MGSFTFKWEHPAEEVYVTGTFDQWTKSVKLDKNGDSSFSKTVELPKSKDKVYYKFVVDNNWLVNESDPKEPDHEGNVNNFVTPDQITPNIASAILNPITPASTTATMAAEQPIETKGADTKVVDEKPLEEKLVETPSDVPGGFPATPAAELEKPVSVNPLPATEGVANPISLQPGEKIPESITAESVDKHVKLDKESYEKSDALPGLETELPPVTSTTIPESSLPIVDVKDATIATVAPGATTVGLAAEVPLEAKDGAVPAVVKESQELAKAEPEASADPTEVKEKAEVEEELKAKVPEAATTSEGTAGHGTEKSEEDISLAALASTAGAAAIVAGISAKNAVVEQAAPVVNNATDKLTKVANDNLPAEVKEKLPEAAQDALKEKTRQQVSPEVPAEVKESIVESGKSPEAATNTEAVEEKKAVESELLKEVKATPAEGEAKTEEAVPTVLPVVPVEHPQETKTADITAQEATTAAPAPTTEGVVPLQEIKVEDVKPVETAPESKTEAPTTEEPKVENGAKATENGAENGAKAAENGAKATETKPADANGSSSAPKKKHNRLSSIFSKIKQKISN